MKEKKGTRIVAGVVLVCFFITGLCTNAFARDGSGATWSYEEKAFYVTAIIERLGDVLELRKEKVTARDLEQMISEAASLGEELASFLFMPDGGLVTDSDDACAAILAIASLYTLRGITLVVSLLSTVLRVTQNPPLTSLGEVRAAVRVIRAFINVALNAPLAGTNGLLTFIQYLACRQAPAGN